jgi:glycosyltransferase involved in cell wall biosynthesis
LYENKIYAEISPRGGVSVAGNVAVHDKTSNTDRYYEAADLYVLPSSLESFGLTLLEATMYGLPIITSGADGIKDVFDPDEMTILDPSWDSLETATPPFAQALDSFAQKLNDRERYMMVRKAQNRVRRMYTPGSKMLEMAAEIARVAFSSTSSPSSRNTRTEGGEGGATGAGDEYAAIAGNNIHTQI